MPKSGTAGDGGKVPKVEIEKHRTCSWASDDGAGLAWVEAMPAEQRAEVPPCAGAGSPGARGGA
jgi:hypothetical protein